MRRRRGPLRGRLARFSSGAARARRTREGHRLHRRIGSGERRRQEIRRPNGDRGRSETARHDRPHREDQAFRRQLSAVFSERDAKSEGLRPSGPMRLLIVPLSAMGDIIHSLPLAENARRAGASVAWLAEDAYAGLLEGNPNIDRLFLASTKRWRRQPLAPRSMADIRKLARELRSFQPDISIDAQGLWKSALLAGLVKAPRVGFARGDRRESSSATLIDRPVRITPEAVLVVDQNLLLLAPAGVPVETRAPDARYLLSRPSPDAEAFLRTLSRPFAVLHPGSARAEKTWGEAQYGDLARRLET